MATFYGIAAIILWGILALLGTATKAIPAFQLLSMCFFISATIMILKRFINGTPLFKRPSLTQSQWLVGLGGLFGFHFCYFMSLKYAPAIEASLIVYLWPLLLAIFVANRHTFLKSLIGGALGFVGIVFLVAGDSELNLDERYVTGYLFALCCAFIWSGYSWFLSRTKSEVDDIGWLSLVVAVFSLASHFALEPSQWDFSAQEWLGIVLLGLGPVGGAFYLWDTGLKHGNTTLIASLSFTTPLISSCALAIAGMNQWSISIVLALTLILVGAVVSNFKMKGGRALPSDVTNS